MYRIKQLAEDFCVTEIAKVKPSLSGRYAIFQLTKKNLSTPEAKALIASASHIKQDRIGSAGLKDKRAITKQLISVPSPLKPRLEEVRLEGLQLSFRGYDDEKLYPGRLVANSFAITVRNCTEEEVAKAKGFAGPVVNYFDDQRFYGANRQIGRAIIKREFELATQLIINSESRQSLAAYLSSHPRDYIGALRQVPKALLKFYISAYQSWLFNELAASRVRSQPKPFSELAYSQGSFAFPGSKLRNCRLVVPGCGSDQTKAIIQLLDEEGISLNDFALREIPELSSFGSTRQFLVKPRSMKIIDKPDELNGGMRKINLQFILNKGSFATMVIKAMMCSPTAG